MTGSTECVDFMLSLHDAPVNYIGRRVLAFSLIHITTGGLNAGWEETFSMHFKHYTTPTITTQLHPAL